MYGVSRRMCYVRVTYVWRDVSTAYVSYVLFLSAVHLLCTICFLKSMRTNGCIHFVHVIRTLLLQYQLSEVEDATGEIWII